MLKSRLVHQQLVQPDLMHISVMNYVKTIRESLVFVFVNLSCFPYMPSVLWHGWALGRAWVVMYWCGYMARARCSWFAPRRTLLRWWRKMYIGHTRLSVCLFLRGRMHTLLHGGMVGVLPSCALFGRLKSVHGFVAVTTYANAKCQRVLVLALCLVCYL